MQEPILIVKDVTKKFGTYTALNQVNISVPHGSIFGLLGPNGAGKTTLMRIINQITAPDYGELYFCNEPLKRNHIGQIGYLPEERGLYKKMKVGEQALYLAQLKGMPYNEALIRLKRWFKKLDILNWWNKKVEELSKGMAQKIQFVVTVIHEPKLLIFDEPFSGFDPINAAIIREEILTLSKTGTSIIFSTHRMESVEEICDHIALINKSTTILEGNMTEIRNQFKSNSFQIYVQEENLHERNLFNILNKENRNFHIQAKEGVTTREVIAEINKNNQLVSFHENIPSMEEIFIKAIKNA